ncbi:hypothetical protein [Paenibacillus sp. CFBP13512]|uniref:hypothetical protein n=1 Tax=Paenibacillus sp. CFBP13512 TaxID=2184007 RepID=UPI001375DB3D|nr:hypothetical protein [Paenibacillus sp. CFBP13512]
MKTIIKARRRIYSQKEMSHYLDMTFREYQLFESLKFSISRRRFEAIIEKIKCDIPEHYIDEIMEYYKKMEEKKIGNVVNEDRKTTYINPKIGISIKIDKIELKLDPENVTSIKVSYLNNQAIINHTNRLSTVIKECGTYHLEMIGNWAKANGIKLTV